MLATNTLRYKLILFTTSVILITLVVVGIAINIMLNNFHNQKALHETNYAHNYINNYIKDIEINMTKRGYLISQNDIIISTIDLINNYQNIDDYKSLVFDNEKKKIADHLLSRIRETENERATLYDKNGKLIAFATHGTEKHLSGMVSYHDGMPIYLTHSGDSRWTSLSASAQKHSLPTAQTPLCCVQEASIIYQMLMILP